MKKTRLTKRVPRLESREMSAMEKKMWKDYAAARKAKTSKTALSAWARKYNVQLTSRNRVKIVKAFKGDGPAPTRTASAQNDCSSICGIKKFERWSKVGNSKMVLSCTLSSCEYKRELKSWVCWYQCQSGIRLS